MNSNVDNKVAVKNLRNRTIRLDREGDYWTDEEIEELHNMFYDGAGITEIAMTLQRTEPAIFQQINKCDLYRSQSPLRKRSKKSMTCKCSTCLLFKKTCQGGDVSMKEGECLNA